MNRNRNVLLVIALFALAGLSAATYVFVTHSLGYELFCPFATGCDTVQNSSYAILFGVPFSLLGMLGFNACIVLALIGLRSGGATLVHVVGGPDGCSPRLPFFSSRSSCSGRLFVV